MQVLLFLYFSRCYLPLLLLLYGCETSSASASAKCLIPSLFNFGDSNSDTGGLEGAFGEVPPPFGMTYFHKPAGRFCDGRLLIDFIAQALGLPFPAAYLQSVGSNFRQGVNFATAGSTIRRQNTTLFQSGFSPFSLDVQVNQFVEFKHRTLTYYSQAPYTNLLPPADYFGEALYVIDIGQNDLTSGYFQNLSVKRVKAYIPQVLVEFTSYVKILYSEGARNFLIMNTGPVGCLPYILSRLPYKLSQLDIHGCAEPYNNVAKYYNQLLQTAVGKLRGDLANATIVLVDNYRLKYSLYQNAHKNGFRFTLKACCGYGGGPYNFNRSVGCGERKTGEGGSTFSYNVCSNPSVFVTWDGVHYTEAANHIMADALFTGNFSFPTFSSGQFCSLYPSKP